MIICTLCSKTLKPHKTGVAVLEMDDEGNPCKLWMADLLACPQCKTKVANIHDLQRPIAEQYQPDFAKKIQSYQPRIFIR